MDRNTGSGISSRRSGAGAGDRLPEDNVGPGGADLNAGKQARGEKAESSEHGSADKRRKTRAAEGQFDCIFCAHTA